LAAEFDATPYAGMKIFLVIAAILIVGASLFADYKWRQWLARHRRDRNERPSDL
jgi:hypothetical protein